MTLPAEDIGHGHSIRYYAWAPDRELNPQYAAFPDVDRMGLILRHELLPSDGNEECQRLGFCEGSLLFDSEQARHLFPGSPAWHVIREDPLTLTPSVLCHCGDHGFIRDGAWVPA